MSLDTKLALFSNQVRNKSLVLLKEQTGDSGIELIQHIANACIQQDSKALIQTVDEYLALNGMTFKSITVTDVELKPIDFEDTLELIRPILKEMNSSILSDEEKGFKKRP